MSALPTLDFAWLLSADGIFQIATVAVLPCWLLLLVLPRARVTGWLCHSLVPAALLGGLYVWLIATGALAGPSGGEFGSLTAVMVLFTSPAAVLAGWVHYLVFDLFVGAWEVRDAARRGVPRLAVAPCLLLTFLVGPAGLLLYGVVRIALRRGGLALDPDEIPMEHKRVRLAHPGSTRAISALPVPSIDGNARHKPVRLESQSDDQRREAPHARAYRPLRILLASYRSAPYTGGQGVFLRHLSRALTERGHHVDVISGPPYPELDPRVRLIELPSLDLHARKATRLGIPSLPWRDVRDPIDLWEYLLHISGRFGEPYTFGERLARYMKGRVGDYDIVHDNQSLAHGLLKLQAMGCRVVGTIHRPIAKDLELALAAAESWKLRLFIRHQYSFLRMQKTVARSLDAIMVMSQRARHDAAESFGLPIERLHQVSLGIDAETFAPAPEVPRQEHRLIATVSADVPLKGLPYLIGAVARLVPRYPALDLTLVGALRSGPASKLIAEHGLGARIRCVSSLTDAELAREYSAAAIAVCPSLYEGFGLPTGEAMACETPVVATRAGALPELVGDAGVLVRPGSSDALATAIVGLFEEPERRRALGRQGRQRILREFTWAKAAQRTEALYAEALAR